MKVNIFVSAVIGLFLRLIYHVAGTVVHFLLLKFSMGTHIRIFDLLNRLSELTKFWLSK